MEGNLIIMIMKVMYTLSSRPSFVTAFTPVVAASILSKNFLKPFDPNPEKSKSVDSA